MKEFWIKNKVFILGLLSAIAVAITPFTQTAEQSEEVKWTAVGYAVLTAVLSYLARNWRGQGLSILGFVGNAAGVAATLLLKGGDLNNQTFIIQLLLQSLLTGIAAAGADPKSRGYEKTEIIQEAKKQGEEIQPADLTSKPK